MGRGSLIPTTKEHLDFLAHNMKPEHVSKMAYFGQYSFKDLTAAFESCEGHALSAVNEAGDLLFIAGVPQVALINDRQHIFYMGTVHYNANKLAALRLTRELFHDIVWKHTDARALVAYIPIPYREGRRFLMRMGWKQDANAIVCGRAVHVLYFDKVTQWVDLAE